MKIQFIQHGIIQIVIFIYNLTINSTQKSAYNSLYAQLSLFIF